MGGSSGKGKKEQKTVQTSAPPAWAVPALQLGMKDAMDAYRSGKGGNVYQGQRVADTGQATQGAIDGLNKAAAGFNNQAFQDILTGGTATGSNLADMAAGKMVGKNSYFNEALQNTLDTTANTISSQMSGAGRYGSGAHNSVMANSLGNIATNAMASQYNQDVQNMMRANQQVDTANQGFLGAGSSFLANQANGWNTALQGNRLMDQNEQNKLNAEWQKWQEEDNRDWQRLGLLQNAAKGFAGNYGSSTGTVKNSQSVDPWQAANNGLGAIGGLLGKSDIRAKENIVAAGNRSGFPLYEFNYIGSPQRWRGVMAQDVLKIRPDAVALDPADGLYCVDYGRLGFEMERVDYSNVPKSVKRFSGNILRR